MTETVSPEKTPPLRRLIPLGFQHVLAMYAGAVAVPLIVGFAMVEAGRMAKTDIPYLISADLLVAGIASVLQSVGVWRFGVRLPLMQGCTFAAVTPMIAIGSRFGVTAIYGSVIASGVLMMLLAPFFARLVRFFPPLVTGTVITIIGLSLMPVAARWAAGGKAELACAAGTLLAVVLIERFAPAALARFSILLGMAAGAVLAVPLGLVDFHSVGEQPWMGIAAPFHFGFPTFEAGAVLSMSIVALVIMTETTGDILAIGAIVEAPIDARRLADGLRADGLSTVLGGIFNTFPYTAFAQNVGLVSISGVRSRFVATVAGAMLIGLGLLPKLGAVVECVPKPVLGGAGIALFGMVAGSGIRTLSRIALSHRDVLVVAIAIGVGLLPVVEPHLYADFPAWFQCIFDSGISSGSLAAIALNLLFNGTRAATRSEPAPHTHTHSSS